MAKPNKPEGTEETILQPEAPKGDEVIEVQGGKAKGVIIDLSTYVDLETTEKAPYHKYDKNRKCGERIKVSPLVAEKMLLNEWAVKVK